MFSVTGKEHENQINLHGLTAADGNGVKIDRE